ncbi:MAG: hypothetical protein II661_06580 [Bacteroidales bacterium]|nr:hypothetical protein [Bacteroidales bacterium]
MRRRNPAPHRLVSIIIIFPVIKAIEDIVRKPRVRPHRTCGDITCGDDIARYRQIRICLNVRNGITTLRDGKGLNKKIPRCLSGESRQSICGIVTNGKSTTLRERRISDNKAGRHSKPNALNSGLGLLRPDYIEISSDGNLFGFIPYSVEYDTDTFYVEKSDHYAPPCELSFTVLSLI